jgi:hypothetical protein
MEKQNITLALPKHLLQRAKLLAVQKQTSISGLLTEALEEIVDSEEGYSRARDRHLTLMAQGFDLGTEGSIDWTRDELHER